VEDVGFSVAVDDYGMVYFTADELELLPPEETPESLRALADEQSRSASEYEGTSFARVYADAAEDNRARADAMEKAQPPEAETASPGDVCKCGHPRAYHSPACVGLMIGGMGKDCECQSFTLAPEAETVRPTKGAWEESPNGDIWSPNAKHAVICKMSAHAKSEAEERANARLIAEAGTVYSETGLTPAQLREELEKRVTRDASLERENQRLTQERDDLRDALKGLMEHFVTPEAYPRPERDGSLSPRFLAMADAETAARAELAKSEGKQV
jgi:hypothetical protein